MKPNYFNTMTDEELAIRRSVIRRNLVELASMMVFVPLCVLLAWLYMAMTPDQVNAENDLMETTVQEGGAR